MCNNHSFKNSLMRFRAFPEGVGPRILSLESVDHLGTTEHFSGRKKKQQNFIAEAYWFFIVCK